MENSAITTPAYFESEDTFYSAYVIEYPHSDIAVITVDIVRKNETLFATSIVIEGYWFNAIIQGILELDKELTTVLDYPYMELSHNLTMELISRYSTKRARRQAD